MLRPKFGAMTHPMLRPIRGFRYGNPEIVAVSQDADEHGRGSSGGKRVAGADFPETTNSGYSGNSVAVPVGATDAPHTDGGDETCDKTSFGVNLTGLQASGLACTNASSAEACVAACCGSPGCTTWQWNPTYGRGSLACSHRGKGVFGACWIGTAKRSTPGPDWIGGTSHRPPPPPPPPSPAHLINIWARSLHDGSTALFFVNNGDAALKMVCDAGCLAAAGLEKGKRYAVRDLFARADLAPVTLGAAGLASPNDVPGDAGSAFIKLTPQQ